MRLLGASLEAQNFVIVDVREPEEFAECHIMSGE